MAREPRGYSPRFSDEVYRTIAERTLLTFGNHINFDTWFENFFKNGFANLTKRNQSPTNYPVNRDHPWGENRGKPRFREWTGNERIKLKYRVIEYWPDREVENVSYVLWGNNVELITQIMQIEYEGGGSLDGSQEMDTFYLRRRGKPQIKLFFLEDSEDVDPDYPPVYGRVSFRLMGEDDTSLSWSELKQYATKIKQLFVDSEVGGFTWKRGKESVTYTDPENGYHLWVLCRNKAEGKKLVQALLAVQNLSLDATKLKHSVTEDEAGAYPIVPPQLTVLGKPQRQQRRRPIADVRFKWAKIFLQHWPKPITLVSNGEIANLDAPEE